MINESGSFFPGVVGLSSQTAGWTDLSTSLLSSSMQRRVMKIVISVITALTILVLFFVAGSLLLIDRGQPTVVGSLSQDELRTIRRTVKASAAGVPFHWLSNGQVSAGWLYLKELYTYRVLSVEVVDADTVLVFTRTNSYYPSGMRRPDFSARRVGGVWRATPPGSIL